MDRKTDKQNQIPRTLLLVGCTKNRDISTEISTKYTDISTKVFPHKTI